MKTKRGEIKGNAHILLLFLVMMIFFMIVAVLYLYNITESKQEIDFDFNFDLKSWDWNDLNLKELEFTGFAIGDKDDDSVLVSVNAGEEVGRVRDDFYGANTHGNYLDDYYTIIDIDKDGTRESVSDEIWHKNALLNSGMNLIRIDMSLEYWTNNSDGTFSAPSWLNKNKETIEYAQNNGMKVILIGGYMPKFLYNLTADCNSDKKTCGANNWTRYGDLFIAALDYYTNNGEWKDTVMVESWNEPWDHFLLSDSGITSAGIYKKSLIYFPLHNKTWDRVKEKYPDIKVGANTAHFGYGTSNININQYHYDWFLGNLTNRTDFISIHIYRDLDLTSRFNQEFAYLLANVTYYNQSQLNYIISEWNVYSSTTKNTSAHENLYSYQIGEFYFNLLNTYPANLSSTIYQWSDEYSYYNTSYYEGYPQRWSMVSEPQLDNAFYPSYNVTKDFAHYHASGNMIINSSSNNNSMKVVASVNPSNILHVTVINTGTSNVSVSVDLSSIGVSEIKDLATNVVYPVNDGIANVGVLGKYDVKHYEGIITIIDEDIENIEKIPEAIDETPEEVKKSDIGNKIVPLSEVLSPISLNNQVISTRKIISSAKNLISKSKETKEDEINSDGITSLAINESENESAEGVEGIKEETEENSNQTVIATSDLLIYDGDINFEEGDIKDYTNTESESSTSKTSRKSSKSLKQDDEIFEEFESEVERTSLSNFISKASVIEDNPIVIITLLLSIGIVTLILIYIIKKRKKGKQKLSYTYTPDMINKLDDWIKRARALGYTDNLMKSMLEKSGWDEKMVRKELG